MNTQRAFLLPAVGLTAATPILTWWAIGDLSIGSKYDYHLVGPYYLDPTLEYVISGVAAVVAVAAVAVLGRRAVRGSVDPRSWLLLATLTAAGALAAAGWRIVTAGGDGANIGGGFVLLTMPATIAAMMVVAATLAVEKRPESTQRRKRLIVAAVLTAPALYAVAWGQVPSL